MSALAQESSPTIAEPKETYKVLARKYRPQTFDDIIGQETLVTTLKNAIETNRIAHAFMLTGVRGVGKTTTARIMAKILNCKTSDTPNIHPCGTCDSCQGITKDRSVDVIEMDAATRTSVDDIREIIDGVKYAPVNSRFKVYIIDEIHMLSKAAFNALLKTLEEPPEHVKFIFATTEIRKVPVTILSRCQRFDLQRVSLEQLHDYYIDVAKKEGKALHEKAATMIATAAGGSVRDGLSLLDQAIASTLSQDISDAEVEKMLGLSNKDQLENLFQSIFTGDTKKALEHINYLHNHGADSVSLIQDLMNVIHQLSLSKSTNETDNLSYLVSDAFMSEIYPKIEFTLLARYWQMLLKGLSELQIALNPIQATEMLILRLAHLANLPTPEQAIQFLKQGKASLPAIAPAEKKSQ